MPSRNSSITAIVVTVIRPSTEAQPSPVASVEGEVRGPRSEVET